MGAAISAFTPYSMSESGARYHTMSLYKQYNLTSLPITHRPVQVKCHTDGIFSRPANLQNCEKLLLASSCLSVHPSVCLPASNKSPPAEWGFMKFDVWGFFENLLLEPDNNNGYFTFRPMDSYDNISLNFFLECKIFQVKKKKNFTLNNLFFPKTVPFTRWCRKIWHSQRQQYNTAQKGSHWHAE